MSSSTVHHVVAALPAVLGASVVLVWRARPYSPAKRRAEGEAWARRHLAYVDVRWLDEVDRQLARSRRVHIGGVAILLLGFWALLPSASTYLACLAGLPALVAVVRGYTVTRPDLLPPGTRVARTREVSLGDYLQPGLRRQMWGLAAVGVVASVVAASLTTWWVATSGLLLLIGAVAVEVTGTRLARMPEPAGDLAHLYWQDALRVDALQSAAGFVGGSAVMVCFAAIQQAVPHHALVASLGLVVMLLPVVVLESRARRHPVTHLRSRLWPGLAAGEVLRPTASLPAWGEAC